MHARVSPPVFALWSLVAAGLSAGCSKPCGDVWIGGGEVVIRSEALFPEPVTWTVPGSSLATLEALHGEPGAFYTSSTNAPANYAWLLRDLRADDDEPPERLEVGASFPDLTPCDPPGDDLELDLEFDDLTGDRVNLVLESLLFWEDATVTLHGPASGTALATGRWRAEGDCAIDVKDTIEITWDFDPDVQVSREHVCAGMSY